ncbi:MAG: depupylase/deamidase Dop [Candidatus Nanopelagicales bacterium]|jgi:Pup amidohydrolase|nr:proteasome accessory factor PafA2 [Actinomycetes bacterium]MCH9840511.1 proteasome accessory factor PafA2 [Actinomycetes bacterium]
MSVQRVMGIETEYGISVPGHPTMNAMVTSSQIVNAYARLSGLDKGLHARWDYDRESPLRDARGFDQSRADADPSQLTDDQELGLENIILTNGARLYVDHAHPEYSSPEVTNPRDAALWDKAGELVMHQAAMHAPKFDGNQIKLYKNNVDNKGASYGTHENYLMARQTPFSNIVRLLTPFFVSRQIFTGAGRLGRGQEGQVKEFQISQRADYFEAEVGLETTLKRPIINTRDEPHADPEKYRRLHVIVGDANMSEKATMLKMGTTSLVLALIEAGFDDFGPLELAAPITAMSQVSYDTSLQQVLPMSNGTAMRAIDIQYKFLDTIRGFLYSQNEPDSQTVEILELWQQTLDSLNDPESRFTVAAGYVDWVAKYALMQGYRERDGLDWDSPRLGVIDLQYSDIDPHRGIALKLMNRGSLDTLFTRDQVQGAVSDPPTDTRAYFRGECVRRYPQNVAAASWDSIVFDTGGDTLIRIPTLEPLRGNREAIKALLDRSETAAALIDSLRAPQ